MNPVVHLPQLNLSQAKYFEVNSFLLKSTYI